MTPHRLYLVVLYCWIIINKCITHVNIMNRGGKKLHLLKY